LDPASRLYAQYRQERADAARGTRFEESLAVHGTRQYAARQKARKGKKAYRAASTNTPRRAAVNRTGVTGSTVARTLPGRSKAGFKKQGEAELEAKDKMAAVPKNTLGEWLRTWLDTYAVDRCQPKTLERYRQLAACILDAPEGPVQLWDVDLADLSHTRIEAALFGLLKLPESVENLSRPEPSETSPAC